MALFPRASSLHCLRNVLESTAVLRNSTGDPQIASQETDCEVFLHAKRLHGVFFYLVMVMVMATVANMAN